MPFSTYKEKVLLISVGTSPQIITEVIYALTVQRQRQQLPMFMPTKIVVVSTTTGIKSAQEKLDGAQGHYAKLANDYHLTDLPVAIDYQIIVTASHEPLDDIRNSQDNADAADFLANIIRQYSCNEDCALHVSIAGGRKTQGYYTGFALSLFGRTQDKLSHILVDAEYEGNQKFFYPTPTSGMIPVIRNNVHIKDIDTQLANVELADIPFLALRDLVPGKYLEADSVNFGKLVAEVQKYRQISDYVLTINISARTVSLLDQIIDFSKEPLSFAFYLMMALAKKESNITSKNNDYFMRPNLKDDWSEYQEDTKFAAQRFIRSYLTIEYQLTENESEEILQHSFSNFWNESENAIAKKLALSKEHSANKLNAKKLPVNTPLNDFIEDYFDKNFSISDVVGKKFQFLLSLIENGGMTANYMDSRNGDLKKLMRKEFGELILKDIIPSGTVNKQGKEERTGRQGLPLDAERIIIIYPQ